MDIYEVELLNKLKDYYTHKNAMEDALTDIQNLLLLYDFDIYDIVEQYPIIDDLCTPNDKKANYKIRTHFKR